jgi:hypothetical protein
MNGIAVYWREAASRSLSRQTSQFVPARKVHTQPIPLTTAPFMTHGSTIPSLTPPPKPSFAVFTTAFTGFLPLFNRCYELCTSNLCKFTTFYRYFFFDPGGGGLVKARETSCERFLKGICDLENFGYEPLAKIERF